MVSFYKCIDRKFKKTKENSKNIILQTIVQFYNKNSTR